MIEKKQALVVDIDGTLCDIKSAGGSYADVAPEPLLVEKLRGLQADGWKIILSTARGMRSNDGNPGEVMVNVTPTLLDWIRRHDIPCDELHMSKPWPGSKGYYIDDRAVRPREFLENDWAGLKALTDRDRIADDGHGNVGAENEETKT